MSRILIIDADDSIRESLDMNLTEEGYDFNIADRGWVGIVAVKSSRPERMMVYEGRYQSKRG